MKYKSIYIGKVKLFWFSASKNFYLRRGHAKFFSKRLNSGYVKDRHIGWVKVFLSTYRMFAVIMGRWLYFITPKKSQYRLLFDKARAYFYWALLTLRGFFRYFRAHLYLHGINKRIESATSREIEITLSSKHDLYLYSGYRMKFKRLKVRGWAYKHSFTVLSPEYFTLQRSVYVFRRLNYPDPYNLLGIRFYKQVLKKKLRKKFGRI